MEEKKAITTDPERGKAFLNFGDLEQDILYTYIERWRRKFIKIDKKSYEEKEAWKMEKWLELIDEIGPYEEALTNTHTLLQMMVFTGITNGFI